MGYTTNIYYCCSVCCPVYTIKLASCLRLAVHAVSIFRNHDFRQNLQRGQRKKKKRKEENKVIWLVHCTKHLEECSETFAEYIVFIYVISHDLFSCTCCTMQLLLHDSFNTYTYYQIFIYKQFTIELFLTEFIRE